MLRHVLQLQRQQLQQSIIMICVNRGMKIYTRTGDKGRSSLLTGIRLSKASAAFDCLGTLDELSSHIGLAAEHCSLSECDVVRDRLPILLADVQCHLQRINSHVAAYAPTTAEEGKTSRSQIDVKKVRENFAGRVSLSSECVDEMEKLIDEFDKHLPTLTQFILPSGGISSCHLHLSRTVCRRAERTLVALNEIPTNDHHDHDSSSSISIVVQKYLNRLSDLLFTLARFACHNEGRQEVVFQS